MTPTAACARPTTCAPTQGPAGSTDIGFTIPAGTAPGAWFLVMRIDATDVEVEPTEGNNGWVKAITVE